MTRPRDGDDWGYEDRPRRNGSRDDDDDDRSSRRRSPIRKRGVSPGVWIGVGGFALLLLLIVGIVLIVRAMAKPRLTEENIAKIQSGMSQKEVEKIVGPGQRESMSAFGTEIKVVVWREGTTTLEVTFMNDQVWTTSVIHRSRW